ncbi:MAG: hypothetical protein ACTSWL_05325 [Promethearchaeota archaeon]
MFEQTFEELSSKVDSNIVTGYLYALSTLSNDIAEQDIEFIQMKKLRFNYFLSEKFILILVTSKKIRSEVAKQLLKTLNNQFTQKYAYLFKKKFNFEVSCFNDFALEVQNILQSETKYFQYINRRNEQVNKFLKKATQNWKDIELKISDQAQNMGSWVVKEKLNIKKEIHHQIQEAHKVSEDFDLSKDVSSEKSGKKNKWI